MNLLKIVIYSALKKSFFNLLLNINCEQREYVAFTNVDKYFNFKEVEEEKLVDVGLGVKISKPVTIGRGLKGGKVMLSSLSHNGVLAVYYYETGHNYQLTDLVNEIQIEIGAVGYVNTGFYDDSMLVLSDHKPLSMCSVKDMFSEKNMDVLKTIGDVKKVSSLADVSLLHSTRVLLFASTSFTPYEFNVDTCVTRELDVGRKIYAFASLTGIDVGVKGVFMEDGLSSYSLNNDNSTSPALESYHSTLCTFVPSSSNPRDLKKGIQLHQNGIFFTDTSSGAQLVTPFKYQDYQTLVRLYQDIFLVCDGDTKGWCLVKIIVP